jgi:hypothetical protein
MGTSGNVKKKQISSKVDQAKVNHWRNIPRDKKGRWIKQKSNALGTVKKSKKKISKKSKPAPPSPTEQSITSAMDQIGANFGNECPRCSGDMKFHRIRCGPEKLVRVKKCSTCNFWLPSASS